MYYGEGGKGMSEYCGFCIGEHYTVSIYDVLTNITKVALRTTRMAMAGGHDLRNICVQYYS